MNDEAEDESTRGQLEPAAAPVDLPKALSEREREYVGHHALAAGQRALAIIDALTAHLAEAVARMTVAERSNAVNCRLFGSAQRDLDASEARVAELEASLSAERDRRVEHRQMNQSLNEQVQALQARVREVSGLVTERDAAEQKLAEANALLKFAQPQHGVNTEVWWERYNTHLATMAVATGCSSMNRTDADKAVLDAMGRARIERLNNGAVIATADTREIACAELARRGLK